MLVISERRKADIYLTAKHLLANPNEASQADIAKGTGIVLSLLLDLMSGEHYSKFETTASPSFNPQRAHAIETLQRKT